MSRLPVLGLRGRLVAALILISAVVLGVVAFTLLPPLQRNLRTEEVRSLRDTALASRSSFEDLKRTSIVHDSPHVQHVIQALERRTGARVLLFDTDGKVLIDTDPKQGGPFDDVGEALGTSKPVTGVVVDRPEADTARLALPLTIDHRRYVLVLRRRLDDARSATRQSPTANELKQGDKFRDASSACTNSNPRKSNFQEANSTGLIYPQLTLVEENQS